MGAPVPGVPLGGKEPIMSRIRPSLLCVPIMAVAVLALVSCRGSTEASPGDEAENARTAAEAREEARRNEPPPPDDYVRYRCSKCSCRVFMGDGAYCSRPSCRHHWSEHQRSFD
jgi:hypothetical protein